ncbi:MAG: type II toxin-antitoxin system death-on-curing family toxin [Cyclobacteriaceae bacterium]|nr:type II toxin-antitoxin system death-on-curing family toxin [Cyclobacteriaceae bacterium]
MGCLYFTSDYAIKIHDKIIEISGGISGVKDFGNIDSPINHIQNDDYYPSFEEKLIHLVYTFNKNHAFNDGNKRTSIAIGAFFLDVNGLEALVNKFIIEMENIAVLVADNIVDKALLSEIIFSIVNEEDYSEELKLKIIQALSKIKEGATPINLGIEFYKDIF